MFRMVASHDHPLLDAEAYALFSWIGEGATGPVRHYQDMALERSTVRFFPMNWTVVHPINDDSPLKDLSKADLEQVDAEILVLVRAHDESYGQSVHARASWKASDILFDERFSPMMSPGHDGATEIDLSKLNSTEKVG
jgi:inward rectifier potassium channel